jgi:membrane complex biogenesis BtpA family protein
MGLFGVFRTDKPVIGMLHLPGLPGSPGGNQDLDAIREWMLRDADALARGGVDALIIENYGDAPFFPGRVPRHTVAFMAVLAQEVVRRFPLPLGVNVLRNDGVSAMAVAAAAGAVFIRVNVYTGARLADQGILEGQAHRILRYRKLLGSRVLVFADVAVKHSAPLAAVDLAAEVEETIARGGADAVIVSGRATGKATPLADLETARAAASGAPVFAGSGVTAETAAAALQAASGLIVGTAFKNDGVTSNPVDAARVRAFMDALPPR